jgi:hypothetical protein
MKTSWGVLHYTEPKHKIRRNLSRKEALFYTIPCDTIYKMKVQEPKITTHLTSRHLDGAIKPTVIKQEINSML